MKILVNLYIGFSQKFCIPKQSNKQKIHNQTSTQSQMFKTEGRALSPNQLQFKRREKV